MEISAGVEIHFHQQLQASVLIETTCSGDAALFCDLSLLAALAIRTFNNLGNGDGSNLLAAALQEIAEGSLPTKSGPTYGNVEIVPYQGSTGRKLFKATMRVTNNQIAVNSTYSGFGFFNTGYEAYAPIAVVTLLTHIYRKHQTKKTLTQIGLIGVCDSLANLYTYGSITPLTSHHALTTNIMSGYVDMLN